MDRRQEIEKLAYELFLKHGSVPGRDVEHWLEAEKMIREKYAASSESTPKIKMNTEPVRPAEKLPEKYSEKPLQKKAETKESKPGKKAAPVKEKAKKAGTSRKEATL